MFGATENRCRLEIDRKLILIDCDVQLLQEYSGMFGKFFLAQLLQIAHYRFTGTNKPIYVYIDECYFYLDKSVTSLLETSRKASIGLTLSHQYLAQLPHDLHPAILSLTSTKFAGGLSVSDAKVMAAAMHTNPDMIDAMKVGQFLHYSQGRRCQVANVPLGYLESLPTHEVDNAEQIRRYGRRGDIPPPPRKEITRSEQPAEHPPTSHVEEKGEW
jgi:hypothetical protein